ncbi:Fanconi anemia core complex-associated protein 100 [Eucyclogobius newberryi]|uniref:Fanconi anemia core complex-associated protein 100 n=1 Tax=Eucyclogobius newberryi TaxID=166745 RepID=UPI003B5B3257
MSGRCAVKTLAEFGFWATPNTSGITLDSEGRAFIYCGSDEVYIFNVQDKTLTGILHFPTSVSDLVLSEDKQHLFVACTSVVYCIRLSFIESSSSAEFKISLDHLVIREEGVLCLLTVGSVLVTLSRRDSSWLLTVNKPGEQPGLFESLSSFHIPSFSEEMDERRPVMQCVYMSDSSSSSESHLEPTLFKLLFGIDSALIKSPVILCGLPDGQLCAFSLRLPGVRVIHSLEQPVVFIGASVVVETEISPSARCLVAVGEHGRVVVIKTCEGATEENARQVSFTEGCVSGKVTSACADKSCLFLSTGSDLLSISLMEESSGKTDQELNEERARKVNYSLRNPISLNVCRITALTKPTCKTAGEVELLGLSDKGQLQSITFPQARREGESSTQWQTHAGRSVKDLLSAIGDVCERASNLKASIKSKNQTLQHLNQVANVSFLLLNNTEDMEQSIRCHATTKWTRLLQKDSLHLACTLKNDSPYLLEQGWTLNITVYPLSDSSLERNTSTNYSFLFCNLGPGQKFEVTLPLTAADDKILPLTISCGLVFSLETLLDEKQLASLLKVQNNTINLPLNTLAVDWLHALQLNISLNEKSVTTLARSNSIQRFLKSKGKNKVEKAENKPYSALMKISLDLLKHTLHANKESTPHLSVLLLDWLLSEPHRGVTGHIRESTPNTAVLHAQGPNGQLVKLVAKEANVEVGKETLAVVEIQVESPSLAAVCGLHHAILDRMQTLVKRAPKTCSVLRADTLALRPAILRAEHLLQQVQDSRVSGAVGVGVSSGHMTHSLFKVYQELRQRPLVIF